MLSISWDLRARQEGPRVRKSRARNKIAAVLTRYLVSHTLLQLLRGNMAACSDSSSAPLRIPSPAVARLDTRTRRRATCTTTVFRRLAVTLLQLRGKYCAVCSLLREFVGSAAVASVLHAATCTSTVLRRLVVTLLQLLEEHGAVYKLAQKDHFR